MSFISLIIDSVLLLGIVAVSVYGATVLPPAAQWPLHLGPGGYGNWVPRNVGLLMGPAVSMIIYVTLAITARSHQAADGASGLPDGLTAVLAVMVPNQIGALRSALGRSGRS
jgi:hypothetical protein